MNGKVENVNARFNSKLGKITVQGLLKLQRCAGKIYSISIKDPETLLQWYIILTKIHNYSLSSNYSSLHSHMYI